MKAVKDRSRQVNIRLRGSVIEMMLEGCRATGLSQGRFIELCVMRHSDAVPAMLERMRKEALHIIMDEMVSVAPVKANRRG